MAHAFDLELTRDSGSHWELKTGSVAYPVIDYRSDKLTPEEKADEHMGGRLLAAGALACFTNSLWNDIIRAGGTPVSLKASIEVEKEKDSAMRTKFGPYTLKVEVKADGITQEAFDPIRRGLMRGSLVTYTMEEGTEMDYDIELID
ncbi:hypothetical protein LJC46_04705 [Desulfovibrio sp. OttesenSCG-928-G15]|nr:hypothetical protein [Desulfovibrio sp. OttesenSCG-928-G15]